MPTKVVQHGANFQPYIPEELKDLSEQVKTKFKHAVLTGHEYYWDDHNTSKSVYQKALNLAKNQYFASTLTRTKQIWNYIKTISGGSKISIPTCIIEERIIEGGISILHH